jgi:hypothetical protein
MLPYRIKSWVVSVIDRSGCFLALQNIYVYCSREGVPDSQRNPKPSPQRKRPSKRCDCRWRIVLFENDQERWEFRKSVNAASSEHDAP